MSYPGIDEQMMLFVELLSIRKLGAHKSASLLRMIKEKLAYPSSSDQRMKRQGVKLASSLQREGSLALSASPKWALFAHCHPALIERWQFLDPEASSREAGEAIRRFLAQYPGSRTVRNDGGRIRVRFDRKQGSNASRLYLGTAVPVEELTPLFAQECWVQYGQPRISLSTMRMLGRWRRLPA